MTLLITGATGFVGRHAVARFAGSGHSVRVLVRNAERARRSLGDLFGKVEVRIGDLTDPSSLQGVCDGIEAVMHTAIANMHTFAAGRGDADEFETQ